MITRPKIDMTSILFMPLFDCWGLSVLRLQDHFAPTIHVIHSAAKPTPNYFYTSTKRPPGPHLTFSSLASSHLPSSMSLWSGRSRESVGATPSSGSLSSIASWLKL